MRILDINFKISEFDKDCLFKNTNLFGEELIKNQLGVIKVDQEKILIQDLVADTQWVQPKWAFHLMILLLIKIAKFMV